MFFASKHINWPFEDITITSHPEDESVVSSEEEDDENSFDDLFGPAESSSDDRSLPHLRGNASQTSSDTGRQAFSLTQFLFYRCSPK